MTVIDNSLFVIVRRTYGLTGGRTYRVNEMDVN